MQIMNNDQGVMLASLSSEIVRSTQIFASCKTKTNIVCQENTKTELFAQ